MIAYLLIILLIICVVTILIINRKEKFGPSGVCAFDLDNTITCGLDNAKNAISLCRENNYNIAFITARPTPWYSDLDLDKLGLSHEDFLDDFYHGEKYECSFFDSNCMIDSIAETKVSQLEKLAEKWDLPRNKVILIDDLYQNIEKAKNHGFSTIYANHPVCGLPDNFQDKLYEIFDN